MLCFLLPIVPPYIIAETSTESNPSIIVNKTLSIHCNAYGIPTPEIKWLFNGKLLQEENDPRIRFLLGGKTLEIIDVKVPDTGRYTCVATNEAGVADRDYDLNVWGKSFIVTVQMK